MTEIKLNMLRYRADWTLQTVSEIKENLSQNKILNEALKVLLSSTTSKEINVYEQ